MSPAKKLFRHLNSFERNFLKVSGVGGVAGAVLTDRGEVFVESLYFRKIFLDRDNAVDLDAGDIDSTAGHLERGSIDIPFPSSCNNETILTRVFV